MNTSPKSHHQEEKSSYPNSRFPQSARWHWQQTPKATHLDYYNQKCLLLLLKLKEKINNYFFSIKFNLHTLMRYSLQTSGLFITSQQITFPNAKPIILGRSACTIHASATSLGIGYVGSNLSFDAGVKPCRG
jgi:hypothetical protein